jgi:hypothetical protein
MRVNVVEDTQQSTSQPTDDQHGTASILKRPKKLGIEEQKEKNELYIQFLENIKINISEFL